MTGPALEPSARPLNGRPFFFFMSPKPWLIAGSSLALFLVLPGFEADGAEMIAAAKKSEPKIESKVSYYHDVRPIFQANCQGCHQPAKSKGGYVMTDFKKMLVGGDAEGAAIVPGDADKSSMLKMLTPQGGEVRMPKGKTPLSENEVALIRAWIAQGAVDDTPADAKRHYDNDHPPLYSRPPVITSIDYSPDGKMIAIAGYHEVLLYDADKGALLGRLIGLSERVQALRFSPDGQSLAVAGGDPARLGEIQVWNVEKRKLTVSAPISYDTLYGVSWSPDGKLVAFGCPDNTVRAIEAGTGKQVVQMGSHSDWPLCTTFSQKSDHIVSGGRDMSVKLTEVAAQRFVDNVTSITPGALKGGVLAVERHPKYDQFVTAGSDGVPRVYLIFREVKREIGDDAQFIADLYPMTGRIFAARFSPDGKRIACGSGLDQVGELLVCSYDYTNDVPKALRDIMGIVPGRRNAEQQKQLDNYKKEGIHELARAQLPKSAIYSLAFSPDGERIAAAGSDGKVRIYNATNGAVVREFVSVPIGRGEVVAARPAWQQTATAAVEPAVAEKLPEGTTVTALQVEPAQVKFASPSDYAQLLVSAKLDTGDTADATRMAQYTIKPAIAEVSAQGVLRPKKNGTAKLTIAAAGKTNQIVVEISGADAPPPADFIRDVSPVMAHLGCNAGTCHGAKDGKNGFKLSLRGYDPEADLRALTDDLGSRRVNLASPDNSLMLLKSVAEVPHEGGRRMTVDSVYYRTLRQWIVNGAQLDMKAPRVAKIEVLPQNPVVQSTGARQQMRVIATYADGATRDVTAEAFIDSGNGDVATADGTGLLTTLRRGEAPVLARFEGNYAATTLTVMGDRKGFTWQPPATWGKIDELVAAKWERMKIAPSDLCTDIEFIRRVNLDLTGVPPTADEVRAFLKDPRPTREKRDELVDRLIGSPSFVDFWANKWADLLQCNSKYLGTEGAEAFRAWIRQAVETNTPYDKFAKVILTSSGSTKENPPASYWKILRTPTEAMENTTHLFLATRFNCNKCHDHPFERWTQDQYYHLAAYFAQVSLKEDPESKGKTIGGTSVESPKPLYEIVSDAKEGDVKHDRTGKVSPPSFPYAAKYEGKDSDPRREQLADWITSADNRYFASSYVNRMWGYLLGTGIIEPIDDIRAGNPPKNPALLDYLTRQFIASNFNVRLLMTEICKSRAYQLSIIPNKWNEDDKVNYSHALARRLPAETLYDSVFKVTGSISQLPGQKPGMHATQLADAATDDGSGLLATLGRPARQSACECERSSDIRLGSVMALLSGPTVSRAINDPTNFLAKLVETEKKDSKLVNEIFMRVVNRPATDAEIKSVLADMAAVGTDADKITNELAALEVKLAPVMEDQKKRRDEAIVLSKTNLAIYGEMTKTLQAELEKSHKAEQVLTDRELKEYEKLLPAQAAFWETRNNAAEAKTTWQLLEPRKINASGKVKLAKLDDGTIVSTEGASPSDFFINARVMLTNVTGIMLEVLPDQSLPVFGPGRATDGNFVLSEIELKWDEGTNAATKMAKLSEARADFSQNDYNVAQAIDGEVVAGRNGWAVAGAPGISRHVATFKLEQPIMSTNGLNLRIALKQHYGGPYLIGRFRLYVTSGAEPLDFGLPEAVVKAVRAPAGNRTPEQAAAIVAHYRYTDTKFWKLKQTAVKAAEPLPEDPKLTELKKALAKAEEPVPIDPYLVQLRLDSQASSRQSGDKRLTMAQDLTWALINSAEFIFNH